MIVGCISGESRSLSGSPFKTLESFLSRVLFYARSEHPGKKKGGAHAPPFSLSDCLRSGSGQQHQIRLKRLYFIFFRERFQRNQCGEAGFQAQRRKNSEVPNFLQK